MAMYTYQNKAWKILEDKLKELVKEEDNEKYKEMQRLLSESAEEAFKQPTKAEDVAELLTDSVNSSMFENQDFARVITQRTHRTLQQSTMRAFIACVDNWADMHDSGMYDLRNESTVKASKKIREALVDNDYFPFI